MAKSNKVCGKHSFRFNKADNGGEAFTLTTEFFETGDPGAVFINQKLSLQSYCNAASFELVGAPLTPDLLRKLANELEEAQIAASAKAKAR